MPCPGIGWGKLDSDGNICQSIIEIFETKELSPGRPKSAQGIKAIRQCKTNRDGEQSWWRLVHTKPQQLSLKHKFEPMTVKIQVAGKKFNQNCFWTFRSFWKALQYLLLYMGEEGTTVFFYCTWATKALYCLLLYLDNEGTTVIFTVRWWRRHNNTRYSTLHRTGSLQYRIRYCSSMRKRKMKIADEALTDLMSSSQKFWKAQVSMGKMKTTTEKKGSRRLSGHQEVSSLAQIKDLAGPAKISLNNPNFSRFRYYTQFYRAIGQGPIDAFAKVDIRPI